MNLSKYYTATADDGFVFTREQGSHFAKDIAGDFNPLHDADARNFAFPAICYFLYHWLNLASAKRCSLPLVAW